ncbi:MAG: tyrosine-protein phosphatase [Actinobacteria bacterium]|nr:tyrosine-protein phosphatase [Actinomycetota bacterium]
MVAWIELDGAVNARDLGGTPTTNGRPIRVHRLLRSDNLQSLSPSDIRRLVDDYEVRRVVDLRTHVEVRSEGDGPMLAEPAVRVSHLSLFPEPSDPVDVVESDEGPIVLPWEEGANLFPERRSAEAVYIGFIDDRPDSVIQSLRLIAQPGGATLVHCAAGKDRTGVVVALALSAVGVAHEGVVADYERSAERIEAIVARLADSRTYAHDMRRDDAARHRPSGTSMAGFLDLLDERFGGAEAWLRRHGWTDADQKALRASLLED